MIHIVAWSGGYDSTLVLDRLCSINSGTVWAFAMNWDAVGSLKIEQEKLARNNYLVYANKKGYCFEYREIDIKANMGAQSGGLPQVVAWFSFIGPYLPEESTVYLGYHQADEFWEYRYSAERLIQSAASIRERKVTIYYPLSSLRKYQIVEEFSRRGIPRSCTWTCENPVIRHKKTFNCGKCSPCISLKLAKYESGLRRD